MRIVVTGCAGYIGSRLVGRLKEHGHHVVGIDRNPCADRALDAFIQCDLLKPEMYGSALSEANLICHLAAAKGDWGITREEYQRDNVEATRTLLETANLAGVRRWIFYSTVSVLGPSSSPLPEGAPPKPVTTYGSSKAASEGLFEAYVGAIPDAQVLVIRPSVVYGPGNPPNTNIFRLMDAIYKNRFIMIGRGLVVKTTSYISNLLDAHMFLMNTHLSNDERGLQVFHYVDTPALTTRQLVAMISEEIDKRPSRVYLPLVVASPFALVGDAASVLTGIDLPITSARVRKFCTPTNFSCGKLLDLGYVQRTSNEEAIQRTTNWYLAAQRSGSAYPDNVQDGQRSLAGDELTGETPKLRSTVGRP